MKFSLNNQMNFFNMNPLNQNQIPINQMNPMNPMNQMNVMN